MCTKKGLRIITKRLQMVTGDRIMSNYLLSLYLGDKSAQREMETCI